MTRAKFCRWSVLKEDPLSEAAWAAQAVSASAHLIPHLSSSPFSGQELIGTRSPLTGQVRFYQPWELIPSTESCPPPSTYIQLPTLSQLRGNTGRLPEISPPPPAPPAYSSDLLAQECAAAMEVDFSDSPPPQSPPCSASPATHVSPTSSGLLVAELLLTPDQHLPQQPPTGQEQVCSMAEPSGDTDQQSSPPELGQTEQDKAALYISPRHSAPSPSSGLSRADLDTQDSEEMRGENEQTPARPPNTVQVQLTILLSDFIVTCCRSLCRHHHPLQTFSSQHLS